MKNFLFYIKRIIDTNLKGKVSTFENLASLFIMNKEASKDNITKSNLHFKKQLPDEYNLFLQNYNGGILFKVDDYAGFKFLSAAELIKHNEFQKGNFVQDWDSNIILFCECIGDAEYLGFRISENDYGYVVHCILDTLPKEWEIIEDSFDNFINKLIGEKGKKYWL